MGLFLHGLKGNPARPAVQDACKLIHFSLRHQLLSFRDINRLLYMGQPPVCPMNQAVIIFINPSCFGIGLFPEVGIGPFPQYLPRAEFTPPFHTLLQDLPAHLALWLLQGESLFHSPVHKENLIRLHIRHIDICAYAVHDFSQNPVFQEFLPFLPRNFPFSFHRYPPPKDSCSPALVSGHLCLYLFAPRS